MKIPLRSRYGEVETGTESQRLTSKGKVELAKTYRREKLSRKSYVNCGSLTLCATETTQIGKTQNTTNANATNYYYYYNMKIVHISTTTKKEKKEKKLN